MALRQRTLTLLLPSMRDDICHSGPRRVSALIGGHTFDDDNEGNDTEIAPTRYNFDMTIIDGEPCKLLMVGGSDDDAGLPGQEILVCWYYADRPAGRSSGITERPSELHQITFVVLDKVSDLSVSECVKDVLIRNHELYDLQYDRGFDRLESLCKYPDTNSEYKFFDKAFSIISLYSYRRKRSLVQTFRRLVRQSTDGDLIP